VAVDITTDLSAVRNIGIMAHIDAGKRRSRLTKGSAIGAVTPEREKR
jgi:translation elongation factor EF-4